MYSGYPRGDGGLGGAELATSTTCTSVVPTRTALDFEGAWILGRLPRTDILTRMIPPGGPTEPAPDGHRLTEEVRLAKPPEMGWHPEISLSLADAPLDATVLPAIAAVDSIHLDHDPFGRVGSIPRDLLSRSIRAAGATDAPIDIHTFSPSDDGMNILDPPLRSRVRRIYKHLFSSELTPSGIALTREENGLDSRVQPAIAMIDLLHANLDKTALRFDSFTHVLLVTPSPRIEPIERAHLMLTALELMEEYAPGIRIVVDRGVDEHVLKLVTRPAVVCVVVGGHVTRSRDPLAAIARLRLHCDHRRDE